MASCSELEFAVCCQKTERLLLFKVIYVNASHCALDRKTILFGADRVTGGYLPTTLARRNIPTRGREKQPRQLGLQASHKEPVKDYGRQWRGYA